MCYYFLLGVWDENRNAFFYFVGDGFTTFFHKILFFLTKRNVTCKNNFIKITGSFKMNLYICNIIERNCKFYIYLISQLVFLSQPFEIIRTMFARILLVIWYFLKIL